MNFQTKDLMISVVPKDALNPEVACRFPTLACGRVHTLIACHWQGTNLCYRFCSRFITEIPCLAPTLPPLTLTDTPCGGTQTPWEGPRTIEDIGALREQLKAQMVQLDQAEEALKEGPATLAEAETLEAHLREALSQVQVRKAELKAAK